MSRRRHGRSRRGLYAVVALLFLVLLGSVAYVFKVARSRTDPLGRAIAAQEAGDDQAAEGLLRDILEADPGAVRARNLLIQILAGSDRVEQAEDLARYWLEDDQTEAIGLRALSQLALRRMELPGAMRYARMVADRDPAFSQAMLMQVQDALGTPGNRERSARAAETLAQVTAAPGARAGALLYAAETLRDLEQTTPDGPVRKILVNRREFDLKRAEDALHESDGFKRGIPAAKALMARIGLLSVDEEIQTAAVAELEEFLQKQPDAYHAHASLMRHFIQAGAGPEALTHAQALQEGPVLLLLRAISALAETGERAAALELIEGADGARGRMLDVVRARVLISGDEGQREEGILAFEKLALDNRGDWALVKECYQQISRAGEPKRALRVIDEIGLEDSRARFAALLERTLAKARSGDGDALETLLKDLAAECGAKSLLVAATQLRRAGGEGETASLVLFDHALEAGKVDPSELRLLRAAHLMTRSGADPAGRPWTAVATEDLQAIAEDPDAERRVLVSAATLALTIDAPQLGGHLMGRALVAWAEGEDPIALYLRAVGITDEARREAIAQGIRSAAPEAPEFKGWLGDLAVALASGDAATLRHTSADGTPSTDAPQPSATLLLFRIAAQAGDWPEAEGYARRILAEWPDLVGGMERVGAVLLRAHEYEEVLSLYAAEELTPLQRVHRIDALRALGRDEDALAEARVLLREAEGSDRALFVMGKLLAGVDPDAAIATIAPISGNAEVDLFRAELQKGRGDTDAAVQIYEELLQLSGNGNLAAWTGLAKVRAVQDRDWEFIRRATPVIEAPGRALSREAVAQLMLLRAQARERIEDYEGALEDYRRVLEVLPSHPIALNNAAWVMIAHIAWHGERRKRSEEALALADRAVAAAPTAAQIRHTRAKVLEALEKLDRALEDLDGAIELTEKHIRALEAKRTVGEDLDSVRRRRGRYLLDKARLLEATGEVEQARGVYAIVAESLPSTGEGRRATEALQRLEE